MSWKIIDHEADSGFEAHGIPLTNFYGKCRGVPASLPEKHLQSAGRGKWEFILLKQRTSKNSLFPG